jgi:hypothetical protein
MDPLYKAALMKRNVGLGEGLGMDSMSNAALTPEVDFSKSTLSEQLPGANKSFEDIGGTDVSKEAPSPSFDYKGGAVAAGKTAAKGGSGADVLGSGLIATGNPYAIAAGLGLMTISSAQKAKQARRMKEYENAVARANQRRSSLENLAAIGQRLAV